MDGAYPRDLEGWTRRFARADIPALRRTVADLARLQEVEEHLNARDIAAVVLRDPLACLRVLAHLARLRGKRESAEIWTIEESVVMMGVVPFLRTFAAMPTVEERLGAQPQAHMGLVRVIRRAQTAAGWARDWAVRRQDLDVERITIAALLHDLAEMLLWCLAPDLALRIEAMQAADHALRSRNAQRAVLQIVLNDLQLELVRTWRLPDLLVEMMDDKHARRPRVRNVVLAVNLARHAAHGWDDAALPDDFRDIADLLHTSAEAVRAMVHPREHTGHRA
jgi:HD-like signal output (HDOD) protein